MQLNSDDNWRSYGVLFGVTWTTFIHSMPFRWDVVPEFCACFENEQTHRSLEKTKIFIQNQSGPSATTYFVASPSSRYLHSELKERRNNAKYIRNCIKKGKRKKVKNTKRIEKKYVMCSIVCRHCMATTVSDVIRIFDILTNRKIDNKLHFAIYTSVSLLLLLLFNWPFCSTQMRPSEKANTMGNNNN